MDFDPHFRDIRHEYSKLLAECPIVSYEDAWSVLEPHLCALWLSAYKSLCNRETYVELLRYRGAHFVHDSICTLGYDESCRVVGALTASQEILPLRDLLVRLADQKGKGVSTAVTLDLIGNTLIARHEGTRKQAEDLRQAAASAVQMELRGAADILRPFIQSVEYWSRRRALRLVREVERSLHEGMRLLGVHCPKMNIKKEDAINASLLDGLCRMAEELDANLPSEQRREVVRRLTRHIGNSTRELMDQLRENYSDELMERALKYLAPLASDGPTRPRNQAGSRHHRLGDGQDVGHFVAHSTGGPPDINLFYQDRRLNRGWSAEGKVYRLMEKYAADHPGTFYFSRPVYEGESTVPRFLELGILLKESDVSAVAKQIENKEIASICRPASSQGLALAWLIGVFDNQPRPSLRR